MTESEVAKSASGSYPGIDEKEKERKRKLAEEIRGILETDHVIHVVLQSRRGTPMLWRCSLLFYLGTWLPEYEDPYKLLADGRRYFTVWRDLKKVADDLGLKFDVSRPKPNDNEDEVFLNKVEKYFGYITHDTVPTKQGELWRWFLTEKGEQHVENEIYPCIMKSRLPALLAPLGLTSSQVRRLVQEHGETIADADRAKIESELKELSWFATDEERKLAYEFLKCTFARYQHIHSISESDRYVIRDALKELQEKKAHQQIATFKAVLSKRKCSLCLKDMDYLERVGDPTICGHMLRAIAMDLLENCFPIAEENWSFVLLDPLPFKNEEKEKLQTLTRIMESDANRQASFRILRATTFATSYVHKIRDLGYVSAKLTQKGDIEICTSFAYELAKLGLARFLEVTSTTLSFLVGTWVLGRIARELWESGVEYKLTMTPDWRKVATGY